MNEVKQYIVIRTDLGMSAGKIAAQASHAAMKVFFDKMNGIVDKSFVDGTKGTLYETFLTEEEAIWKDGLFTKIVKRVKSEDELLKVYEKAKAAGLNVSLIKDAALTELKEPAYTAIAIGPNYVEKCEPIVKRLQNLQNLKLEMDVKGQSLSAWKSWLEEELNPPVNVHDEQKYVLEAFLELIEKISQ